MVKDPQREDVGGMGQETDAFLLMENLWSEITRSTAFFKEDFFLAHPVGESKVGDHILFLSILENSDHDVFEFEIPMDDSLLPEVFDPHGDILDRYQLIFLTSE